LYKIRKFVPIGALRLLYFSFVHCHLQLCVISWATANNSVLQTLWLLQSNILRIMTIANIDLIRHVTSLGHRGAKSFLRGGPNFLNYAQ